MPDLERLKKDLEGIQQELERLQPGSHAYSKLIEEQAKIVMQLGSSDTIVAGRDLNGSILIQGDGNYVATNSGMTQIAGDLYQLFTNSPILSWRIRVREFKALVAERTRGFVGRDFIFQAIDDLLKMPEFPSGYIVIRGEPGIGKTSLIAQLVQLHGYVHHFNIALQNIRSVHDFLNNICAQLIVRYNLEHVLISEDVMKDSGFLLQLLDEIVEKVPDRPIIVLIDALDEAEDLGLTPKANRMYLPPTLPRGVYFIVSTREKADYHLQVDNRKDIYLRDDDPRNLDDVRQYISTFINHNKNAMQAILATGNISIESFSQVLTEKSEGNFMYLVHILPDIRDGRLALAESNALTLLPTGLKAYYQRHWRVMRKMGEENFDHLYQPVVCVLATMSESVTVTQLARWSKLSPLQVKDALYNWREFLNVNEQPGRESLYQIYHTSFHDFLQEYVGFKPYYRMIGQSIMNKIKTKVNPDPKKSKWI